MSVTLLSSLVLYPGCSRVTLHVIEKEDIVFVEKGETLTAPKNGAFLSDEYLKKVAEARIK